MGETQKKKSWWRDTTLITMVGLLAVVSLAAFVLHGVDGLREGGENSLSIIRQAAPALILGFILAGLLTVLFPP